MATASRAPSALFDGDASRRRGAGDDPYLPCFGGGQPHLPTDIPQRSTAAASADLSFQIFTAYGDFHRFRRSAKAFPFDRPSTRFWPTWSTPLPVISP